MAADKYTIARMKDKTRIVSPSLHFRPKQLERLTELAGIAGMKARSGRNLGEPSVQTMLTMIADLEENDRQVLGEFIRDIARHVASRSAAEQAEYQLKNG
jgi:hypothetical protein